MFFKSFNLRTWFVPLWLVGCIVTILQIEFLPDTSLGDGYESLAVARSLVAGQGFANPYLPLPTGPTAHVAPVYPAIVAGAIRYFGNENAATLPLAALHIAMHGLQFALLPALANQLLGDARAGLAAFALLACLPVFPLTLQSETIFQIVTMMLAILTPVRRWSSVPWGLLCALSLHVNPSTVFVLAGWLWWKRPTRRWLAVALVTLAAAMMPWAVRNYQALGRILFVRDNLPLELYVSNNDLAEAGMRESSAMVTFHPNSSIVEAQDVQQMGESAYMRDRGRIALDWIRLHPVRFAKLTLVRFWRYWFPSIAKRPWQGWLICLLTVLSLPGVIRLRRHPIFLSALLLTPLIYYAIQVDERYRLPNLWSTLLAAGWSIVWLLDRWRSSRVF